MENISLYVVPGLLFLIIILLTLILVRIGRFLKDFKNLNKKNSSDLIAINENITNILKGLLKSELDYKSLQEKRAFQLTTINESMIKNLNELLQSIKSLENSSQSGNDRIVNTLNEVTNIE